MLNDHYNVIESKMAERQPFWTWSRIRVNLLRALSVFVRTQKTRSSATQRYRAMRTMLTLVWNGHSRSLTVIRCYAN